MQVAAAGEQAAIRFIEFFTANIRNPNTRAAYARAVADFFRWCEERGLRRLDAVQPVHVAGYFEDLGKMRAAPSVKQLSLEAEEHKWPNRWASFAQWKERGASVRKGEHGLPVVFYSPVPIHEVEEDADGKKKTVVKTIPVFRYSTVFNIAQVDNPPLDTTAPRDPVNPIEKVEQFVSATQADIRYGGDRAYYSPSSDHIQMPVREAFTGTKTSSPTEAFYGVLLHELCHWTGGKSRLNRENHNRFGDEAYAAEELIAEIGAAFSCAKLGITPELRADHVQYVASWLKILKEDKRAIFTAASAATRAVEYLETLQSSKEVTTTKKGGERRTVRFRKGRCLRPAGQAPFSSACPPATAGIGC